MLADLACMRTGSKRAFRTKVTDQQGGLIFTPTKNVCRFLGDLPSTREVAFKPAQTVARCCEDFCGPVPLQRWVHFGPRMPAQGLQNTPPIRTSGGSVYLEAQKPAQGR